MHNKHKSTLDEMLSWPYGHPHVVDMKYETLINDTDMSIFRASMERLDVAGFDLEKLLEFYWTHSMFGGLQEAENLKGNVKSHIKSGKTAQWREKLPAVIAQEYQANFGEALTTLGYEDDANWPALCADNIAD